MVKSRISIFTATFLIIGFLFVTFIESANAQICVLTIEKVAIPADDTPFDFIISGDLDDEVTLLDPDDPEVHIDLDEGTVTVTEELPPGWELESIECEEQDNGCGDTPCLNITIDEESNSITAQCIDDDEGSCTFTNTFTPEPREVPTLSQWGLIAMAGILGLVGFMIIRKRKVIA